MVVLDAKTETLYLTELLLQASRWQRSEGEVLTGVELEIQDRLRRLCGVETIDDDGMAQSDVVVDVNSKTHEGQCRIKGVDGKKHWVSTNLCVQVPNKHSKTGFSWQLRDFEVGESIDGEE